jgi:hypothetical protein
MYNFGKNRQQNIDPEVPQSLEGVINSLETLLEHRDHDVPDSIQESLESFADSMGEQYDDPLVPETNPVLEDTTTDIPVLSDVVSLGDTVAVNTSDEHSAELDILLDALRNELDNLVEDILSEARGRFSEMLDSASSTNSISAKDNLNDFMRDALNRHGHQD